MAEFINRMNRDAEVRDFATSVIKKHPDLYEPIKDLYDLYRSEVEDGESPDAEAEKFKQSVNELVEQQNQK